MKLITGATGFIGSAIMAELDNRGIPARGVARNPTGSRFLAIGDIGIDTDWEFALEDVDVVIHTAARAHVIDDKANDPLAEFRRVNVDGTVHLARQAHRFGVKRFVFISSIGVVGNQSQRPLNELDTPAPIEPYAISKLEAEQGLHEISSQTGMEIVVVRPPLVYGPNAPGNFSRLLRLVDKALPLPLAAVDNQRSLVALDNLVNFIITCIDHPGAANETFHVSDGEDISTPELLRRLGYKLGKSARLIPMPLWLLYRIAALAGKRAEVERLCSSLQVDISKARKLLGWEPPLSLDEGLDKAVRGR